MGKKVFVGGLNWNTNDESLRSAFTKCGNIDEATVVIDRATGKSRGFGFVSFSDPAGAQKAIAEMNGMELDGRSIKVNEAEDKPRTGGGGGRRW